MVLKGSEVKSLRNSQVTIKDGFALIRDGELWLENVHIAPYTFSKHGGHDPERRRKLLMSRREIDRLIGKMHEQGLGLIPLSIYFTHGLAKVELGLAKGRRSIDKRHAIRDREQKRDMERAKGRRR